MEQKIQIILRILNVATILLEQHHKFFFSFLRNMYSSCACINFNVSIYF